jgi:hypothetical protein
MQRQMEKEAKRYKSKKARKARHRARKNREARSTSQGTDGSLSSSSASSQEYRQWMSSRAKLLEEERAKLIKQWRDEAMAEEDGSYRHTKKNEPWGSRFYRRTMRKLVARSLIIFFWLESFFANLPLTIGAIALACANLGVDWFKFAETNLDSCQPVHFHSSQCTFPEFPGCYYCDQNSELYKLALNFHWTCSVIAGVLALSFILKLFFAPQVVLDACKLYGAVFVASSSTGLSDALVSTYFHRQ